MLQELLVVLAVLCAALYVAWSLVPVRTRFTALSRLDAALGPGILHERVVAPLLRRATPAGGCASCGSGGAPATTSAPRTNTPAQPGRAAAPAARLRRRP